MALSNQGVNTSKASASSETEKSMAKTESLFLILLHVWLDSSAAYLRSMNLFKYLMDKMEF